MKAKKLLPVLFTLLLFPTLSIAQNNKIELLLIVDTDNITQDNINETCRFENQPEDTNITEFTTEVQVGDEIKWKITEEDGSSGKAKLVKFKHETGKDFFGENEIPVNFGRIKGVVKQGDPGDLEKYTLLIEVKDNNNEWQEYTIDPKLKLTQ